jgi:hypothetical protein
MRVTIAELDDAPDDLRAQAPFAVKLSRRLPGPDRPDYWLGRLNRPIRWRHEERERLITHVVLAAKLVGQRIGVERKLRVGILYVTDQSQVEDHTVDLAKCSYVAVGMATRHWSELSPAGWVAVIVSLVALVAWRLVAQ